MNDFMKRVLGSNRQIKLLNKTVNQQIIKTNKDNLRTLLDI